MSKEFIDLNLKSNPMDCFYILDTNVLLPLFGLESDIHKYKPYLSFFSKIAKCIDDGLTNYKIIITPLQLSELINALLRFNSYKNFVNLDPKKKAEYNYDSSIYYKREYRSSAEFENEIKRIISDFNDYENYFELKNNTIQNSINSILNFNSKKLDFNDNYILNTAIEYDAILISNDSDFHDEEIKFATYNHRLIKMEKTKRDNEIIAIIASKSENK